MKTLALTFLLTASCQLVHANTNVTVYEHTNYRGGYVELDDLDLYDYIYFTDFDDETSSFIIHTGSCVEMHVNTPPSYGNGQWFWTMDWEWPNIGPEFNDRISSVKSCDRTIKDIQCPEGLFVKKITWDNSNMMTGGIELHCYEPQLTTPNTTLRTHGSEALYGRKECAGIRGVSYNWDERRYADIGMAPLCEQGDSGSHTIACDPGEAVTGMIVEIENRSGFIKSSQLYCSGVKDIEAVCAAHDNLTVVLQCDATDGPYPMKCHYTKTYGLGYHSSLSYEERTEMEFHTELGFDIGAAGYGLSVNFKTTVGVSNTTGYSWTNTEGTTFSNEVTIGAELEAPGYCFTELHEIDGKCSFLRASPAYFRRTDACINETFVTDVYIPNDWDSSEVFIIPTPYEVMSYLETYTKGLANIRKGSTRQNLVNM